MEINSVRFSERAERMMTKRKVTSEDKDIFIGIMNKAEKENSEQKLDSFVKKLSDNELEVIAKVQGLANYDIKSRIKNMDYEHTYNLVQSPDEIKDLNNDGIYGVGDSNKLIFPPTEAPESVKKAYEETTKDMSNEDAMFFELSMIIRTRKIDPETGKDITKTPEYLKAGFSYTDFIDSILKEMKPENYDSKASYERDKNNFEEFSKNLMKFGDSKV